MEEFRTAVVAKLSLRVIKKMWTQVPIFISRHRNSTQFRGTASSWTDTPSFSAIFPIPIQWRSHSKSEIMTRSNPLLSVFEARVLGVLIEKHHTVPDSYPLTLKSITSGCNQKTARDPLMDATEEQVQLALDGLRHYSLILETSGGRVARFEENAERVLQLRTEAIALLATLVLRGPQTAGELRINCERIHRFSDISAAETVLEQLAQRELGALVVKLPRQSGAREARWTHLLSGTPTISDEIVTENGSASLADINTGELANLKSKVARLEDEIDALKAMLTRLYNELGVQPIDR
jgi:uncharacterized protein YceH (UPF0502 family)